MNHSTTIPENMTTNSEQTALQQIVSDEEQAREMVEDLKELPIKDEDRWELSLEMNTDDIEVVQAELEAMLGDDE